MSNIKHEPNEVIEIFWKFKIFHITMRDYGGEAWVKSNTRKYQEGAKEGENGSC